MWVHDVIRNIADINDLHEVLGMLVDITSRWMELGIALGLKKPTLDTISYENPYDLSKCKMEMLSHWLQWRDDSKATCNWQSLAAALRHPTVNQNRVAENIERNYLRH